MDILYRLEFNEAYDVNALVVRADSVRHALELAYIILGEMRVNRYLFSISKID